MLGALHEFLRGLNAAEPALIQGLAERRPDHLYEGLLTVLLRLVFILYAEDRDLLPSAMDGASRALYEQSYSVRGLYARRTGILKDWEAGIAHTLSAYAADGWERGPSPKQARHGARILKMAKENGVLSETATVDADE